VDGNELASAVIYLKAFSRQVKQSF